MNIPPINNKRELDNVVQGLRLRQFSFTLETIESIRNAICNAKLDELLKKIIEREFSNQWKELMAKHKIMCWPSILQATLVAQPDAPTERLLKNDDTYLKQEKAKAETKNSPKGQINNDSITNKSKSKTKSRRSKVLKIPKTITTKDVVCEIISFLKSMQCSLMDEDIERIRERIINPEALHLFIAEANRLKKKYKKSIHKNQKQISQKSIQNTYSPYTSIKYFMSQRRDITETDNSSLYQSYEYGLSDW